MPRYEKFLRSDGTCCGGGFVGYAGCSGRCNLQALLIPSAPSIATKISCFFVSIFAGQLAKDQPATHINWIMLKVTIIYLE
jgi:hypothetical protein